MVTTHYYNKTMVHLGYKGCYIYILTWVCLTKIKIVQIFVNMLKSFDYHCDAFSSVILDCTFIL